MKEAALVVIKPDGIAKGLTGLVIDKFEEANLEIIGTRVVKVTRRLAEEHYPHLKRRVFFEKVLRYLVGDYHGTDKVLALVYYGNDAIKKLRAIAGATNPEEADLKTVRGSFGRITTDGVFENVVHVSSDRKDAEREIKLWMKPGDLSIKLFPKKAAKKAAKKKATKKKRSK